MTPFPPSPEQRSVIDARLGPAVVVAGAGSGKTETMANRVVHLIDSGGVDPARILGLTFTRRAAAELADRIRRKLRDGPGGLLDGEPTVTTYDAFSARIVTEHAMRVGREPRVEILRPAAAYALAAAVVDRYEGHVVTEVGSWPARGTLVTAICQLHERLTVHRREPTSVLELSARQLAELLSVTPNAKSKPVTKPIRELIQREQARPVLVELVRRYRALLDSRGLMDFASVAALAAELAAVPAVREAERDAAHVVLLDEFQDTNPVQLDLLAGLFEGGAVTAVGDPNQAIFAWRGAGSDTLGAFRDRFRSERRGGDSSGSDRSGSDGSGSDTSDTSGTDSSGSDSCLELHLSTSYRNPKPVLAVANALAAPLRAAERRIAMPELRAFEGIDQRGEPAGPVQVSRFSTAYNEARAVAEAAGQALAAGRSAAVLLRTRRQISTLLPIMREAGLPVTVVGLSGLLGVPAVIDVVSVLQVLDDADRGDALMRILTGSRWRIGPQDLRALRRLGRRLSEREPGRDPGSETGAEAEPGIVDALDHLADQPAGDRRPRTDQPAGSFSPAGQDRLRRLGRELRALRARLDQPLPDLVLDVIRTTGLDVELAAAGTAAAGMVADLDSFVGEADAFASSAGSVAFAGTSASAGGSHSETARSAVSLTGFLAFLDLAADTERGLERDESALDLGDVVEGSAGVDLLTVHAAKGLEWDAVFVPGMSADVFPTRLRSARGWLMDVGELPGPLRRDKDGQPELGAFAGLTSKEAENVVEDFTRQAKDVQLAEERRLAYVAVTRARETLWCSSYAWGPELKSARGHSVFLDEIRALEGSGAVRVAAWEPDGPDPRESQDPDFVGPPLDWPYDPLELARRPAVEAGAELVRAARRRLRRRPEPATADTALTDTSTVDPQPALEFELMTDPQLARWTADVDALCHGARAAATAGRELTVALPAALSVSDLVALARDPDGLASRLRRPMPQPPRPSADLGTAFHEWLEQRWRQEELIDLDDVPGASDDHLEVFDTHALAELQATFARSEWASRTPEYLEFPFLMPLGPVVLRGRIDAVFTDSHGNSSSPGGSSSPGDTGSSGGADVVVDIVDWKTGRPPHGDAEVMAVAVQLAAYRLAWHRLHGIPLNRIRAAFHYVAAGRTVRPVDLLDAAGLLGVLSAAAG